MLVVEDELLIALDLCDALEALGYTVLGPVTTGADALRVADEARPDVLLMDIRIDGPMDGIETAAILRSRLDVPIVFLSANADAHTLERALAVEPEGYLAKPYNSSTIRTTVEVARRRRARVARLENEAHVDALTGLFNRRRFDERLRSEIERASVEGSSLGLIACDLDHFKTINDRFGHDAGDAVLSHVGHCIAHAAGPGATPCRIGGEEFAILIPGTSGEDLYEIAERLRASVAALVVPPLEIAVTTSIGLAVIGRVVGRPSDFVRRADEALYRAKAAGRNRIADSFASDA